MSLPDDLWEALGLQPEAVRRRADFFSAYVSLERPSPDVHSLIRLMREGPLPTPEGNAPIDLLQPRGAEAVSILRRLQRIDASQYREQWVEVAERADALRECGMAQLTFSIPAGRASLRAAATAYQRLGMPFGLFLEVAATGSRRIAARAFDRLEPMLGGARAEPLSEESELMGLRGVENAPAQQVALLLSAMSDPVLLQNRPESFAGALAEAPQARATWAVGATAQPMATWWGAGRQLAALARGGRGSRQELVSLIADLGTVHGRLLQTAALDRYHWSRAVMPTDLVDLDLAGLVAITVRAFPIMGVRPLDLAEDFGRLPPLARISITLGAQLGGDDPEPEPHPDHPWPGPMTPSPDQEPSESNDAWS